MVRVASKDRKTPNERFGVISGGLRAMSVVESTVKYDAVWVVSVAE